MASEPGPITRATPPGTLTYATRVTESPAGLVAHTTVTGGPRRHPAQVTADRLADHTETYADQLTPNEQTAMASSIRALTSIAAGERP